jgi:hypothetical protein
MFLWVGFQPIIINDCGLPTLDLVAGDSTILKNDGVRHWVSDDIPYMKWKIIQSCSKMFQTTNQRLINHR